MKYELVEVEIQVPTVKKLFVIGLNNKLISLVRSMEVEDIRRERQNKYGNEEGAQIGRLRQ